MNKLFTKIKRKFNDLPDPPNFSTSLTPKSYEKIFTSFGLIDESAKFLYIGCGKGYPLIYASIVGFTYCEGWDISRESVDRSLLVIKMTDREHSTKFNVFRKDAFRNNISEDITHVQVIISLNDEDFKKILDKINYDVILVIMTKKHQEKILNSEGFFIINKIFILLETSQEKRTVCIIKRLQ